MALKFQFFDEIIEEGHPTNLEFNSPSLDILSQRFVGTGKHQILDLGTPVQSNLAFFSESSCRFYVEDLYRFFIAPQESRKNKDDEDDDNDVASAIVDALDFEETARFDLVLGWDLFSYMERATIESLMARVAGSCRTGTLLFLTVSTGAMIPSKPARITITHDGRLCYRSAIDSQSIPNPHVSPNALERMMPGFRLLHSFLLGEQMQEFLFSYA